MTKRDYGFIDNHDIFNMFLNQTRHISCYAINITFSFWSYVLPSLYSIKRGHVVYQWTCIDNNTSNPFVILFDSDSCLWGFLTFCMCEASKAPQRYWIEGNWGVATVRTSSREAYAVRQVPRGQSRNPWIWTFLHSSEIFSNFSSKPLHPLSSSAH